MCCIGSLKNPKTRSVSVIKVYGIPNCGSVKKARALLESLGVAYEFVDFKKTPPNSDLLHNIYKHIPMLSLINTKGTTYKKLKAQGIEECTDDIIIANPSLIKRPLIVVYKNISTSEIEKVLVGLQDLESLL